MYAAVAAIKITYINVVYIVYLNTFTSKLYCNTSTSKYDTYVCSLQERGLEILKSIDSYNIYIPTIMK